MTLTDQLAQWRESLEAIGAPVAPALKPGTSRAEINAVLGPALPHAVLEWFAYYLDDQHQLEVDDALYDEVYDTIVGRRPAQEI
ncbi:hypothetical protein AB0C04_11890 [Micromonospora sp. NPDC048909]|uniref:hypothetical protein n=1 Tax=Micromonospora sp. NPDC048909 TaxID=3155643 RepID=UPI0033F9944C